MSTIFLFIILECLISIYINYLLLNRSLSNICLNLYFSILFSLFFSSLKLVFRNINQIFYISCWLSILSSLS